MKTAVPTASGHVLPLLRAAPSPALREQGAGGLETSPFWSSRQGVQSSPALGPPGAEAEFWILAERACEGSGESPAGAFHLHHCPRVAEQTPCAESLGLGTLPVGGCGLETHSFQHIHRVTCTHIHTGAHTHAYLTLFPRVQPKKPLGALGGEGPSWVPVLATLTQLSMAQVW